MDEILHMVDDDIAQNDIMSESNDATRIVDADKYDLAMRNVQVPAEIYDVEDEGGEGEEGAPEGEEGDREGAPQRLPRERPLSLQQLVRRAHEGLYPGNDRLAWILKNAKASPEAIKLAKELRCSVCDQHAALQPPRRAAPPRLLHVNEIVGIDTVYIPDFERKRRPALNIVDWASRFQMIIPLRRYTASETRRAYLQWVKIFGPPTKLYVDLGREFLGAFELGATSVEPSKFRDAYSERNHRESGPKLQGGLQPHDAAIRLSGRRRMATASRCGQHDL